MKSYKKESKPKTNPTVAVPNSKLTTKANYPSKLVSVDSIESKVTPIITDAIDSTLGAVHDSLVPARANRTFDIECKQGDPKFCIQRAWEECGTCITAL